MARWIYDIQLPNILNKGEEMELLHSLLINAGTTWLTHKLRELQISGRTKIVDAFRHNYIPSQAGRSHQDELNSAAKLLDIHPLNFWITKYVSDFPIYAVNHALKVILKGNTGNFSYTIKVTLKT